MATSTPFTLLVLLLLVAAALFAGITLIQYFLEKHRSKAPGDDPARETFVLGTDPLVRPLRTPGRIHPKSRLAYVLLAFPLFGLCLFGFHNFYALRIKCAVAQLLIAVLSLGILTPVNFGRTPLEMCLVDRDGRGVPLQ